MDRASREWTGALEELSDRFGLAAVQRDQLAGLLRLIADDPTAPTSVRDPRRAVDVHIADSLTALEVEAVRTAGRLAELGAGAGFPGLALAIARADLQVDLIESQARKCRFLEDAIARLGVENARVICARAEEWRDGAGSEDVVVARALAPQAVVLEYAAPLLKLGGTLVDWRGRRNELEEAQADRAAGELGMELAEVLRTEPYAGSRDHHLHVYRKLGETAARFPRRAGVARKRPLGAA